jgi:hypothetical protein
VELDVGGGFSVEELVGNVPACENTKPFDCRVSLEKEGREGSLFAFFLNFIPLKLYPSNTQSHLHSGGSLGPHSKYIVTLSQQLSGGHVLQQSAKHCWAGFVALPGFPLLNGPQQFGIQFPKKSSGYSIFTTPFLSVFSPVLGSSTHHLTWFTCMPSSSM